MTSRGFRNQTSYDRFWQGQNQLTTICTNIRNLTRSFLTCSYVNGKESITEGEKQDVERVVRIMLAYLYAVKTHLRAEWGAALPSLVHRDDEDLSTLGRESMVTAKPLTQGEFVDLLPAGTISLEDHGLGLPLQLTVQMSCVNFFVPWHSSLIIHLSCI